ncbi:sulfite exporter TauE/SafE family protein [Thermodesulfatator atlanticus]
MDKFDWRKVTLLVCLLFGVIFYYSWGQASPEAAKEAISSVAENAAAVSSKPWWFWPLALFITTFLIGIVAVLGGVGGGVLFVPIVSGFFPFNLDFVRTAGLLVALSGALAAGPGLLMRNLASLRLAIPIALIASTASIIGAMIGLALPRNIVQILLGVTILFIVALMFFSKKSEFPEVKNPDRLGLALGMWGIYREESTGEVYKWHVHRTPLGLLLFIVIGVMAGMFGLGAGWANIPVLNLLMGAPIKISVATSKFLLSITDTSAAWIYINSGGIIPLIVIPSLVGIMLGSFIGVRLLAIARPAMVRWIVIGMLLFAGVRAVLKGLGI